MREGASLGETANVYPPYGWLLLPCLVRSFDQVEKLHPSNNLSGLDEETSAKPGPEAERKPLPKTANTGLKDELVPQRKVAQVDDVRNRRNLQEMKHLYEIFQEPPSIEILIAL